MRLAHCAAGRCLLLAALSAAALSRTPLPWNLGKTPYLNPSTPPLPYRDGTGSGHGADIKPVVSIGSDT